MAGFTFYDELPVVPEPTIQELIAGLTAGQKGDILNSFVKYGVSAFDKVAARLRLNKNIVKRLFQSIKSIELKARALMRGEVVVTPAVLDPETGEVVTPAVYNTPPTTANALLTQVQNEFADDFTSQQVLAILTKMVEYSKHDGTGNWAFYSANVIL